MEYDTTIEQLEETAQEFGRHVLVVPRFGMIIVMDDQIWGEGFIKQFENTPYGRTLARRWAVRMEDFDETSDKSFELLRSEYIHFLENEKREEE